MCAKLLNPVESGGSLHRPGSPGNMTADEALANDALATAVELEMVLKLPMVIILLLVGYEYRGLEAV